MRPSTIQMFLVAAFFVAIHVFSSAVAETIAEAVPLEGFANEQQEQRYKKLIYELRCLVCQNQNIADSNAALAKDLRNQTSSMIREGKSDKEIVDFMVERYGDFVLYRPPVTNRTLLLWLGPLLIVMFGVVIIFFFVFRRNTNTFSQLNTEDKQRAQELLDTHS